MIYCSFKPFGRGVGNLISYILESYACFNISYYLMHALIFRIILLSYVVFMYVCTSVYKLCKNF